MSFPPLSELLRMSYPPKEPTPAERFAPLLLPDEEILWVGQPDAECHTRYYTRVATTGFVGAALYFAILPVTDYYLHLADDKAIFLCIVCSFLSLLCLIWVRISRHRVPDQCFAVTNSRILSYDPQGDSPDFIGLPLSEIIRISVKTDKQGCGTIRFNPWLFRIQNPFPFYCIENAETVASLIMETRQKALSVPDA